MSRFLVVGSLLFLFMSCGKEDVTEGAPSLIGTWIHYSAADAWEIVYIKSDGNGMVEWYTNSKLHEDTKEKKWFIKDNRLSLGKVTFSISPYDVEEFPTLSSSTVIEGFDTLTAGKRYIVMDGRHFVEKN